MALLVALIHPRPTLAQLIAGTTVLEVQRHTGPSYAALASACSGAAAASEALGRALYVPGGERALLAAERRHRRAERRRLLRSLQADRG